MIAFRDGKDCSVSSWFTALIGHLPPFNHPCRRVDPALIFLLGELGRAAMSHGGKNDFPFRSLVSVH